MPNSAPARAATGFLAAAISVLTFHQLTIGLLHLLAIPGLEIRGTPYNFSPVPPFGVPVLLNLCFWGGLYGAAFGLLAPKLPAPMWRNGIVLGVVAVLVGFFVVATIKHTPIGGGWVLNNWIRSLLINGSWGLGVGLIYPALASRVLRRG